jgi:hypothetical protein
LLAFQFELSASESSTPEAEAFIVQKADRSADAVRGPLTC